MGINNMNLHRKTILREPSEESVNLYPGLVVDDARVSGAITVGSSRLPLSAFIGTLIEEGWQEVTAEDGWPQVEQYGWTQKQMSDFLYNVLQARGEFGRLLLVLAEAHRVAEERDKPQWWQHEDLRRNIRGQLQQCLVLLSDGTDAQGEDAGRLHPPSSGT